MRVVFMGTPDFSVGTLDKIIEAGHNVVGVYTQPDKPKGRGKEIAMSAVKQRALELELPVFQPDKVRRPEIIEELRNLNAEVIVVVAFGQLLPKEILEMPKYGCVNVHASLLPAYRGAAPIQWAVIDGCEKSGVTTMAMDVGLDTGDMIMQAEVVLDRKETFGSLWDKLSVVGADLLVKTLEALENGTATRTKQNDELSNYAKMIDKTLGEIDFKESAAKIERLIRGVNPKPGAFTQFEGKTLKIWDADIVEGIVEGNIEGIVVGNIEGSVGGNFDVKPGTIIDINKKFFVVQCGEKALQINEVQLEGKKRMATDAFLRGNELEKGTILGK